MLTIDDHTLIEYFKEDVPYLDLTTYLQEAPATKVRFDIFTREDLIVSCSEEAQRLAKLLGCEVNYYLPSKHKAQNGDTLLSLTGDYKTIHQVWRSLRITSYNVCYTKLLRNTK